MRLLLLLILLLLISNTYSISKNVNIATDMDPGKGSYTTELFFGSPIKRLKLQVSFRTTKLLLFYNIEQQSVSYQPHILSDGSEDQKSGTEIVYFGSRVYRVEVESDSPRGSQSKTKNIYNIDLTCLDCDGILGLAPGSFFWDIWPSISFSYGAINLGDDKDSFLIDLNPEDVNRFCELEKLHCHPDTIGICTTDVFTTNGNTEYRLRMMGDNPYIYLPERLYNEYFHGKNIYRDNTFKDWKPLALTIHRSHFESIHKVCESLNREDRLSANGYELSIMPEEMIEVQGDGMSKMLVRIHPTLNDTIEIGIPLWKRFLVRKTTAFSASGHILLKIHNVNEHLSTLNVILILIVLVSWIRWNMTSLSHYIVLNIPNIIYLTFEVVIIAIAITSVFLSSTTSVLLPDFTSYYIWSCITAGINVIAEIIALIVLYKNGYPVRQKSSKEHVTISFYQTYQLHVIFICHFVRNVSHQMLSAIAMILLLLEQRTEGISSILTSIVNVFTLYILAYYTFSLFVYTLFLFTGIPHITDRRVTTWYQKLFFILLVLYMIGLVLYQVYVTHALFLLPFLEKHSLIYIELAPFAIYTTYTLLIILAIVFNFLNSKRAILSNLEMAWLEHYNKGSSESKKSESKILATTEGNPLTINNKINDNNNTLLTQRRISHQLSNHTTSSFIEHQLQEQFYPENHHYTNSGFDLSF